MQDAPGFRWITASALGLGVGFLAVLQAGMLMEFGFDWKMHWTWVEQPAAQNATEYVSALLAMLAGGAILGSAQACILHSRSVSAIRWILATAVGFGVVAVTMDWPLIALGVLGAIPGPVEPIMITVGGSSFAGVFQYWTLRRQGIHASKWLVLWIGGLVAGIVPTAILMISLETLEASPSWPLEVFLNGFIVAGVAAWISRKALFAAFSASR